MFGFGKGSKVNKLKKKYSRMLEEARDIQRGGDMKAYALKMDEAENLYKEIEALDKPS